MILQTEALTFSYSSAQVFKFPDLRCEKGQHLMILGNSGKGKTTLLHLIAGLLPPNSGSIQIAGTETQALSIRELDLFRGKNIGLIFQKPHFLQSLNVMQNLSLAQSLAGMAPDKSKATQFLEHLGLADKTSRKPHRLSQGEQQRLAVARAVLNQPQIILADEPTSSLDDDNCQAVLQLLLEQAEAVDASLILVTHDQRLKESFPNRIQL